MLRNNLFVNFGIFALLLGVLSAFTVFGQDDLTGEYSVSDESISMPLIGQVRVIGLTTAELEQKLEQNLVGGGFLKNPRVSAEVTNFQRIYLLGEVNNPGSQEYSSGLTVLEAISQAGGFSYRANKKIVGIKGKNDVDEADVLLEGNTMVRPGDTIRVKERLF